MSDCGALMTMMIEEAAFVICHLSADLRLPTGSAL